MVRLTIPNPLGPPVTFDTSSIRLPGLGGSPVILPFNLHRKPRLLVVPLLFLIIFVLGTGGSLRPPLPPSYSDEYNLERYLPQVDTRLPFPEGSNGRYVKFDVPQGTGFNHQLSRILLNHHLAVLSNRAMAFQPIVNDTPTGLARLFSWPWRASKVPLSAFLGSIYNGFEALYNAPRAVPLSHYDRVCPSYKRKVFTVQSDEHPNGELKLLADGQERIHQLQVLLLGSDELCVSVVGDLFDESFFDSSAHLDLVESFLESPVMKHFSFSPRVLSTLNRHLPYIAPESPLYAINGPQATSTKVPQRSQWKHILALHLRRNDFDQVCAEKGQLSAPFVAFNKLPLLPGNENVPPPPDMVEATRLGLYRAKCSPSILEIIARARRMRINHPLLTSVYILSDGDDAYLEETRNWMVSEGWQDVFVGGKDFADEWEEKDVSIAVDMEVARRAGVFVGNGFSTTSSNIVLLRTRDGIHPDLTQFW